MGEDSVRDRSNTVRGEVGRSNVGSSNNLSVKVWGEIGTRTAEGLFKVGETLLCLNAKSGDFRERG